MAETIDFVGTINDGTLTGVKMRQFGACLMVYYPHRKTADLYLVLKTPRPPHRKTPPPTVKCCNGCGEAEFPFDKSRFFDHLRQHDSRRRGKKARA
jgi:hypothetical protein